MSYLGVGKWVCVSIPFEDLPNNPIAEFNGQEFEIAKSVQPKKTMRPYYELKGAESKYGIPYGFLREWLTPLD